MCLGISSLEPTHLLPNHLTELLFHATLAHGLSSLPDLIDAGYPKFFAHALDRTFSTRVYFDSSAETDSWRTIALILVVTQAVLLLLLLWFATKWRRVAGSVDHNDEMHKTEEEKVKKPQEESSKAQGGRVTDISCAKAVPQLQVELGGQLIKAQEEERARVARELHDGINQRLALLANRLAELKRTEVPNDQNVFHKEVNALWQLTNEIAADIQRLSHELHPSKLHYLGLGSAVRDLCQEFAKQYKVEVDCVVRDLPRNLDTNISLNLFRTIQESLHNVAKHSGAAHVKVGLVGEESSILLRVSDDGIGFQVDQPRYEGLGLISIRERVLSVGGELSIWSRPSLGTQVEARVPLTPKRGASVS